MHALNCFPPSVSLSLSHFSPLEEVETDESQQAIKLERGRKQLEAVRALWYPGLGQAHMPSLSSSPLIQVVVAKRKCVVS